MEKYYIASCVFTAQFPELSIRIQNYGQERFGLTLVRCCIPRYKLSDFENRMPEGVLRDSWRQLPDSGSFHPQDEVYSLCHNCNNIIEEMHSGIHVRSLWELLDADDRFQFPNYHGLKATVQDCWRSRDRTGEQDAVRSLLRKMNIGIVEAGKNREDTDFCGVSLYRPQPPRNPKLAPKHYLENATGLFLSHTPEEQAEIMQTYCSGFTTKTIICYCHYCLEGLLMGRVDGRHLAHLLFPEA